MGSFGQSLPKPIGFVNDFENIFTDKQEQVLDSLVKNFEKETTIQITIVTLDSSYTNKSEFDNYTFKLANNWGVGQKDKDNGILIGISSSMRKMRIKNGYGIEKLLTDEETKALIDSLFIPEFKKGIIRLIDQLEQNINKEFEIDTSITVEWLGISCYCPNWIEISHLKELKNDTLGIVLDEYSISLLPSDSLNNIYNHPAVGTQTPLVFKLKGRYFRKKIKHEAKGMSYVVKTFQYDTYEMVEY